MADMDAASEALMRKLHRELNGLKPRASRMAMLAEKKPVQPTQPKTKEQRESESEASSSGSEEEEPPKQTSKRQSACGKVRPLAALFLSLM